MIIKIISDINLFYQIKLDWDNLFLSGNYSVFQSFEFNYSSWKFELSMNRLNKLCIIVLKNNLGVYAIFPFYIDNKSSLRFINDTHADFCDYISNKPVILSELIYSLKKEVYFKSIRLINFKINTNIYNSSLRLHTQNMTMSSACEYSILNIEEGIFPYNVPHYRSHQKHRINKAIRKNESKKHYIYSCDHINFPREELRSLSKSMIQLGIRSHIVLSDQRLSLVESLYDSGLLVLNIMMDNNKIICCNILLKTSSNIFLFWIDLFDTTSMINITSYIKFIKTKSKDQSLSINFGRGKYFYKTSNFNPSYYNLYQINIFSNKWDKFTYLITSQIRLQLKLIYNNLKR